MKILDRYVWKELLTPFTIALVVFTFLLLIDRIFDITDLLINKGVAPSLVFLLIVYMLPTVLVLTVPIGFLFAILVAFGRLSGDMEIVALKASGISPGRLLRPVLAFGLGTTLLTAYLMLEGMPRSNYAFKSLVFEILQSQATVGLKERVFNDTFGGFVIYVDEMAPDQIVLRRVFVADERRPEEFRVIAAAEGRLISDAVNRRVTLRLLNGAIHETNPQDLRKYREVDFQLYDITLVLENALTAQEAPKGDREMSLAELHAAAAAAGRSGQPPGRYLVEIHKKYAIPAACLVFAVLGLPLGIRTHRGGRWAAFVASLPVIFFYHIGLSVGETLGDREVIPPWLAMWAPNLLVGGVAVYLLWAMIKERPIPWAAAVGQAFWSLVALGRRLGQPRAVRPARRVAPRRPRSVARRNALNVVDRYLGREYSGLFGYGLALATVIVIVGDLMGTVERYIKTQPALGDVLLHFVYRTPPFVYEGLHIVVLMTTILLFLGLSRSNELTALKAGGVSLYRVSLPVFGLAALVTVGALGFQETLLPMLNQKGVEVDETKIKRRSLPQLRKRSQIWYRGRDAQSADSRIYHIDLFDPTRREMSGVAILGLDREFRLHQRWDVRSMRWSDADDRWTLHDGMRREFRDGQPGRGEPFRETPFREVPLRLPERFADFAQVPKAPDVMNYLELREYIGRLQAGGHQVGKYLVDLYAKLSFPFAALIMTLVGIPFALQSPRGGRVIGIALCLVLGLGYFVVHSAAIALARTDILPPIVAAWSANFLFGTLGLFLFLRART